MRHNGFAIIVFSLALALASPAGAGVYTVTTTHDTADGSCDQSCSLREAIIAANEHPGPDVILLQMRGTYALAIEGTGEDACLTGDLDVTDDLTIQGLSPMHTVLDGRGLDRVLDVGPDGRAVTVELRSLTVTHGLASLGGGVRSQGRLVLSNTVVEGNRARSGGGVALEGPGTLELVGGVVRGNLATYGDDTVDARGEALSTLPIEAHAARSPLVTVIFEDDFEAGNSGAWSANVGEIVPCDGAIVNGRCWWFGENNQSCDTVCAVHGGYIEATRTYAGSGGSDSACTAVLTAIGAENPAPVSPVSTLGGISGMGCGSDYTDTATAYRLTSTTTSSASSASNGGLYFRRACACGNQPPPGPLSYSGSPFSYTQCVPITPISPSGSGYVAYYSISPALPAGLALDPSTGTISGTPTATRATTSYGVTAHNAGGTSSTNFFLTVSASAPSGLSYPQSSYTFTAGVAITPQSPTVTGCVSSYSINPALPGGLNFSTSTGVISGTPSAAHAATNYLVTATNGTGSTNVQISIEVTAPFTCSGDAVGGYCWYFGTNNQSCDTVCTSHGGYNAATRTYAGSDGSSSNCGAVMTAIGASNPTPVTAVSTLGGIGGMGCGSDYTDTATTYRLTSTTTSSASSSSNSSLYFRRACACNE